MANVTNRAEATTDDTTVATEDTSIMDMDIPVTVLCKVQGHGEFLITPNDHLGNNPEQIAYGCPKCGECKSNYVLNTINQNDKIIKNYFSNSYNIVNHFHNSVVAHMNRLKFYTSNTFGVNPLGTNGLSNSIVDSITDKLLKIFPATKSGVDKFFNFIDDSQIYANHSPFSIEDYAVCELNGYIIVFHLDLYNGLGTTINNIVPKNLVVMTKSFVTY